MHRRYSMLIFLLTIILCFHHPNASCNHKDANREEEPKEPLGIVTEIAAIIFLVSFTDFFRSSANMELTSRICICICAVIHWRSLANSFWIFYQSASLTFTDTFNYFFTVNYSIFVYFMHRYFCCHFKPPMSLCHYCHSPLLPCFPKCLQQLPRVAPSASPRAT